MTDSQGPFSRRRVLRLGLAWGALALGHPLDSVLAQGRKLKESPNTVVGPFYPLIKHLDQDADLTVIAGGSGRAEGKILHLTGRVLNRSWEPVRGARVEIWQADSRGLDWRLTTSLRVMATRIIDFILPHIRES